VSRNRLLILGASAVLAILAARPSARARPRSAGPPKVERAAPGLTFRLSEGTEGPPPTARPPAASELLTDDEVRAVLARLPPMTTDPADEKDFALREGSLPPPRTGRTVQGAFPPPPGPAAPDAVAAGPLRVLRHAPDGDVGLAPNLSVTFSQPMVALTSHAELSKEAIPVRLSPEPPGQWRWVGTKTLVFEPAVRFPMATTYTVEAPAGLPSATGGVLAAPVRWTFTTPPPALTASHPKDEPARRDTLLFAAFDQRVDPQAVRETIVVRAGQTPVRARLATAEEVKADDGVSRRAADAGEGRWIALRALEPLPADSPIEVTVGPGTPSAEGPRRTQKPQAWSFQTFGPLRVTGHECGWKPGECPPFTPWQITFSNPIDAQSFRKEMVRVEPDLPALKVDLYGDRMVVSGRATGRTAYRVTLAAALPDAFGQTLGRDETVEFQVTAAPRSLTAAGNGFVVLDPAAGPRFSVYSVNHDALKVRAYAVGPADWPAFQKHMQLSWSNTARPDPPGRLVLSKTLQVEARPDELTETAIDLSIALREGLGQVVLIVEPAAPPRESAAQQKVMTWVEATRIGLDAFAGNRALTAWATSLADGRPLSGVEIELWPAGIKGTTGADGLAVLPLAAQPAGLLVARQGGDVAILPESAYWWSSGSQWKRGEPRDELRWYVFDDRKMYRPGEEVRIKGWIRRVGYGEEGDVKPLDDAAHTVAYTLRDSQGNEVTKGSARLNAWGAFDLSVKLPPTMNLGHTQVRLVADALPGPAGEAGREHDHGFEVQEFRRPEFEVTAEAGAGPHLVGGSADATVTAAYYAGGALAGADVAWRVAATPGSFTPPNRDDFTFGEWTPWWESRLDGEPTRVETFAGRTDPAGRHRLRMDFIAVDPPRATSVRAEATVMDVNRQAWTATANLLVHPAAVYVGLKSDRLFVQRGETLRVQAIVTDLDGGAVTGRPVSLRAERLEWERQDGEWKESPVDGQDCALQSAAEAGECRFETKEGGSYRVTATVADAEGRRNQSRLRLWVAGGAMPPSREVEQEKVTLVPDKKEYAAGDTAEVLVLAPFAPAEGVVSLRRAGILRTERFRMSGSSHTLRVRIEEGWTPNVHVQVDLVGAAARTTDAGEPDPRLPARPAFAAGTLNLSIPPKQRTLALTVTPRDKALEPGAGTVLDVNLRDAAGQPVAGGEVAVVVVDEAILSLTGYRLPDPLPAFYAQRPSDVHADSHLRAAVVLGRPQDMPVAEDKLSELGLAGGLVASRANAVMMPQAMPAPAAAKMMRGRADEAPQPIRMRIDFNALALFAASLPTDASGRAQVAVKLPDSLTRYRVMAVAATKANAFGSGESTITARLPLMVRPSPPRFLNFGDRFELPVVVQNQTDTPMSVSVAVRAGNAELVAGQGRRLTVAANDRAEVRFPAAARSAGTARFQVGAVSGAWADASEVQLPVWTPATTEAFATYGQIDQGAIAQPVKAPPDVVPELGGLEVTTSSTALQALTDAVLYLQAYPFECAEQLSSRVMAVAALRDVLTAFRAEGLPSPDAMIAAVKRDVERLRALQADDGGFPFWRRGDESWPYIGIHVAHALQRAKEKGFDVPAPMLDRSRAYLKGIDGHIPAEYSAQVRRTLIAYALYVRNRMGDADPARARALVHEEGIKGLSFEAIGWLLPVLSRDPASSIDAATLRGHLANHVTETAAAAHFVVDYGEQGPHLLLYSDRRADAILLEALIADQPKSDLIPKIVEGLLGHRTAGRWANTQENAFVLLALDRYFNTYEKTTPDFVARVWLGQRYAGEHAFKGRTTDRHHVDIPMRALAEAPAGADLTVGKDGPGRLYYRLGLRYAPASLDLAPADQGFAVERVYEAVDDPADVRREADGWTIRAGSRVRVKVTMAVPSRRYHVALVDPLPAGLEPMNPELATTGTIPDAPPDTVDVVGAPGLGGPGRHGGWWWWWRRAWFDHQNMRDDRVEAFASLVWEGVYTYRYVARATTPGRFVVPPPRAEEMYAPETFGRGATDRVVVE
jgi:alpha-2-macroglobulin